MTLIVPLLRWFGPQSILDQEGGHQSITVWLQGNHYTRVCSILQLMIQFNDRKLLQLFLFSRCVVLWSCCDSPSLIQSLITFLHLLLFFCASNWMLTNTDLCWSSLIGKVVSKGFEFTALELSRSSRTIPPMSLHFVCVCVLNLNYRLPSTR